MTTGTADSLPRGWAATTLGEIGRYHNGRAFKPSDWMDRGRPIIRIQNLTGTGGEPHYFDGPVDPRHEVARGELLISWAATLGAYIWHGPPAVLNQHTFKVESFIDRRFHYYAAQAVIAELYAKSHGSGMVHVTKGKFEETPISLPPLPEQRRIVEALETHFTRLDAAVATLERVRVNLKRYRAAVLQAAVEGRLTSSLPRESYASPWGTFALPASWRWKPAGELSERLGRGITPPSAELSSDRGDVPFVKVMNVTDDGRIDFSSRRFYIPRARHQHMARSASQPGDVLMSIVGPPLGKAAVIPPAISECNINQAIVRFRPRPELVPEYLCIVLLSPRVIQWTEGRGTATAGQTNLNLATCRDLPVPLPPLDEQRAIVEVATRVLSIADAIDRAVDRDLTVCARLRQSLLRLAFDGRLVPQDPSDEPASVLLDRIRAERASSPPKKKSSRSPR